MVKDHPRPPPPTETSTWPSKVKQQSATRETVPWPLVGMYVTNSIAKPQTGLQGYSQYVPQLRRLRNLLPSGRNSVIKSSYSYRTARVNGTTQQHVQRTEPPGRPSQPLPPHVPHRASQQTPSRSTPRSPLLQTTSGRSRRQHQRRRWGVTQVRPGKVRTCPQQVEI